MKISLVMPSRGRPQNLVRLWESFTSLADLPQFLQLCVYNDVDDLTTQFQLKELAKQYPGRINWVVGPRINMSQMTNEACHVATGELLFLLGDDVVCKTKGWDTIVIKAFHDMPEDKIGIVYGRDGIQDEKLATHPILHKNWYKALGRVTSPSYEADYADNHIMDLANALGRRYYVPELFFHHHHYSNNLASFDTTYRQTKERSEKQNSGAVYYALQHERNADIETLRKFIKGREVCQHQS